MFLVRVNLIYLFVFLFLGAPGLAQASLSQEEMVGLLTQIDDRQRNGGDYKSLAYIEQREKGKETIVYEAVIYRRDADDRLMILFLRCWLQCFWLGWRSSTSLWLCWLSCSLF